MERPLLTCEVARSLLCPEKKISFYLRWRAAPMVKEMGPRSKKSAHRLRPRPAMGLSLIQTYDTMSGSQPCEGDSRMFARANRMRLDDEETRIRTLEMHADHSIWKKTPYISLTNCSRSLPKLANDRLFGDHRSVQWIVVIDPRIRFNLGLPVLHYAAEIARYRVETPYGTDYLAKPLFVSVGSHSCRSLNQHRQQVEPTEAVRHNEHRINLGLPESVNYSDFDRNQSDSDNGHDSEHGDDSEGPYDSDDSYERVCEENSSGELMKYVGESQGRLKGRAHGQRLATSSLRRIVTMWNLHKIFREGRSRWRQLRSFGGEDSILRCVMCKTKDRWILTTDDYVPRASARSVKAELWIRRPRAVDNHEATW
nr:hypothetical protein CFP56_20567 [Quercus suber]